MPPADRGGLPAGRIHLIGVGGSGMSGLARLLRQQGCEVSGSDRSGGPVLERLRAEGVEAWCGHEARHVAGAAAVVYSSAIGESNPARVAAREGGVPQFRRAEMLARLLEGREVVLVCGTHGKTTTTLMLTLVLRAAGWDPGYYIGAEVPQLGPCADAGGGRWMVVEADESDGSFQVFGARHAVLLNAEADHLDYYGDAAAVEASFRRRLEACGGVRVVCADDPGCGRVAAGLEGVESYGFAEGAGVRIVEWRAAAAGSEMVLEAGGERWEGVAVGLPGRHNVLNATAALAVARGLGAGVGGCRGALAGMAGAGRRLETVWAGAGRRIVDDYGHHPTEIRATLETVRSIHAGRIRTLFQPHRYSRSRLLGGEFAGAFGDTDELLLAEIYGAGEAHPGGDPSAEFAARVREGKPGCRLVRPYAALRREAAQGFQDGDCLVTLGAGDIGKLARDLGRVEALAGELRGRLGPESVVRTFEPMRRHTTLRVGGPADWWVEPASEEDLAAVLGWCRERGLDRHVIGRGSNLLVRDNGIRGVCLHLARGVFTALNVQQQEITAGAGVRLKQVSAAARGAGMGGLEFLEGIPGSVGGALRMNAGAMGSWMMNRVRRVRAMAPDGTVREWERGEIEAGYRETPLFRDWVALGAVLEGPAEDPEAIRARLDDYNRRRWASQPAAPSAGCAFKNPAAGPAGRLIDEAGLKGKKVGGASVSSVHGNFIINDGDATADDVLALVAEIRRELKMKNGVELEMEMVVLGEE